MSKNKKILALLVGALSAFAFSNGAFAQSAMLPAGTTLTVAPSIVTNYMFRGQRLGGLSFEGTAELNAGTWATGVWWNNPIEQAVPGSSDPEIDPYVNYSFAVGGLNLTTGATLYWYPNVVGAYGETFELNAGLNFESGGLSATPKIYYDTKLKQVTLELAASYTAPIEAWDTTVTLSGLVGDYLADSFGAAGTKGWGTYYQVGLNAPYQIADNQTIDFGVNYHSGSDSYIRVEGVGKSKNSLQDSRTTFSVTYSYGF